MEPQSPESGAEAAVQETVLIGGIQLILAEKRTSLSVLRTGIAVLALPLAVLSLLIATSRYYRASDNLHLLITILTLCLGLVILGTYLVVRSFRRIRHFDTEIRHLRRRHPVLEEFFE